MKDRRKYECVCRPDHLGAWNRLPAPHTEIDFRLSPSAKQCGNPCSGPHTTRLAFTREGDYPLNLRPSKALSGAEAVSQSTNHGLPAFCTEKLETKIRNYCTYCYPGPSSQSLVLTTRITTLEARMEGYRPTKQGVKHSTGFCLCWAGDSVFQCPKLLT